jgi:hypothetical protein
MAVDTAARRFSALNPAVPWGAGILPDGAVAASDRRALAKMYSGLAAGNAYSIETLSGSFVMTGSDVELTPTTSIDTAQERFAAMHPGCPWRGPCLFPTGSIGRPQRQVIANYYVPYATGPTYTLEAEAGAFVWDGEPSFSDFEVTAESGVFTMTGVALDLIATRTLVATAGVFTMTGSDSDLRVLTEATLIPEPGLFVMTGNEVTFGRPRTLEAMSSSFVMTGEPTRLVYTNERGQEFEGSPSRRQEAGSNKKRQKYEVEVDGEVFHVTSKAEAEYVLEQLRNQAEETAKLALDRANKAQKRPIRKILKDAEKTLQLPNIESEESISTEADKVLQEIEDLYKSTLQAIEISALLRKQEDEEEEAILLMLL